MRAVIHVQFILLAATLANAVPIVSLFNTASKSSASSDAKSGNSAIRAVGTSVRARQVDADAWTGRKWLRSVAVAREPDFSLNVHSRQDDDFDDGGDSSGFDDSDSGNDDSSFGDDGSGFDDSGDDNSGGGDDSADDNGGDDFDFGTDDSGDDTSANDDSFGDDTTGDDTSAGDDTGLDTTGDDGTDDTSLDDLGLGDDGTGDNSTTGADTGSDDTDGSTDDTDTSTDNTDSTGSDGTDNSDTSGADNSTDTADPDSTNDSDSTDAATNTTSSASPDASQASSSDDSDSSDDASATSSAAPSANQTAAATDNGSSAGSSTPPPAASSANSNCAASSTSPNDATVNLIKSFESFVPNPAPDPVKLLTVGFGHKCQKSNCAEVPFSFPLSQSTATQLLASDASVAVNCLHRAIPNSVVLNDNQFGGLTSFAFNVGCGTFSSSTLLKRLKAGEDPNTVAAQELPKFRLSKGKVFNGLVRRRAAEVQLFQTPSSVTAHPLC